MGTGVVVLNMPNIKDILDKLGNAGAEQIGKQKAKGQYLQIPAEIGQYQVMWVFQEDIYITGIRYSQSAWKYQDCWGLRVGEKDIYETVFTKEVGEYKHFNRFELVPAGTEIIFDLSNNSGNSRDLWVDLEYLGDLQAQEPEAEPAPEDEYGITHDYDYLIRADWESPSSTDIDLWLFINRDSKKKCGFTEPTYFESGSAMWLDRDYTNHIDESHPEIATILRFEGQKINIQINNFNGKPLTQDVTVGIFRKGEGLPFYTINIRPEMLESKSIYVCDLDIDTGTVTEILSQINSVGDF